MARITKPLTISEIRKAKPKDKLYKLYDGQGLYLAVRPSGKKVWRFDYVDVNKKRQTHTIGDLDFISLDEARAERLKLRERLFRGKSLKSSDSVTFEDVYKKWFVNWSAKRAKTTTNRTERIIYTYFIPKFGNVQIDKITTKDIADILHTIDQEGKRELLNKAKSAINLCFSYAVSSGYRANNPVSDINNSIFSEQVKSNNQHLHKTEIYLIHQIINKDNNSVVRSCLEHMIRNLARPQEAAGLLWSEIDEDKCLAIISAERMKMRKTHYIPLSKQSMENLRFAKENFLDDNFVFPGNTPGKSLTVPGLRSRLYQDNINSSSHGFRHLASTVLNESRLFHSDLIEAALAHEDTNVVRATYNKAEYVEQRREMMQWWSDFIDKCDTKENNERALKEAGISLI